MKQKFALYLLLLLPLFLSAQGKQYKHPSFTAKELNEWYTALSHKGALNIEEAYPKKFLTAKFSQPNDKYSQLTAVSLNGRLGLKISEHLTAYFQEGHWGVEDDRTGKVILPYAIDYIEPFVKHFIIREKGWYNLMNAKGEMLLPKPVHYIEHDTRYANYLVWFDNKVGVVKFPRFSPKIKTVFACVYDEIIVESDGFTDYSYRVKQFGKWGRYSSGAKNILPVRFEEMINVNPENNQLFFVKQNNLWGVSTKDSLLIACRYSNIRTLDLPQPTWSNYDWFETEENLKYGLLILPITNKFNPKSHKIRTSANIYDEIIVDARLKGAMIRKGFYWGLLQISKEEIKESIPCNYQSIEPLGEYKDHSIWYKVSMYGKYGAACLNDYAQPQEIECKYQDIRWEDNKTFPISMLSKGKWIKWRKERSIGRQFR